MARASDCVKVAIRVRPLIGVEIAKGDNECVVSYPQQDRAPQIQIGGDKCFTFDYLFSDTSQQKQVYDTAIKPLVHSFLEGYNATVIAYGQTGSGKTYTMGTLGCDDAKLQEEWGVIPSAIHDIFNTLNNNHNNDNNDDYKIQCSFIEIYNEEIKDLLDPRTAKSMQIRENVGGPSKIHIPNMKLEVVQNSMDLAEALDRGGASRATAYTQMNAQSSRSHAIFTIHLHHIKAHPSNEDSDCNDEKSTPEPVVIQSKFHFVDLAGSERAKKTGASGTRLMEGISINGGLLALGNVIAALGDPRLKSKHVPFRDSKITRLLQDSLGGNSCTLMIACVSPARSNMLETKNTLNYANRAKNIKNKAVVNRDPRSRQILELRERVKQLERQLKHGGNIGGGEGGKEVLRDHGDTANDDIFQQQIEQISQLQVDLGDSNNEMVKLQEKIKNLRLNLSELQDKYYNEVGSAKAGLSLEKRKRLQLIEWVKGKYGEVDAEIGEFSVDDEKEIKEQCMVMERLKLENNALKNNNEALQKTIMRNEYGNQQLVHNLHDQVAKLVRGDDIMKDNLISPTKRFDITSPAKRFGIDQNRISELSVHSGSKNLILLTDDDDDDDEDEEDDEYEEELNDNDESDECDDDDDDDDNDIAMTDPNKEILKQENKKKVKETNSERVKLKEERKIGKGFNKKLLKEQKQHHKQMAFIENEKVSRERSQRLKSEKYNREINKTTRDISNLQVMLKLLYQQRQTDAGKQVFYEKQLQSLTQELDDAHREGRLYEVEKSKLNPTDIKKLQAQDVKIANYQSKVKALHIQIRSYKDKLGQIRKLEAMHREDMLKMNQMTRKLSDLKKKKVNLQRKLKEENKGYVRWKQHTEKTIKQLRKIQREKTIQLQRNKTALTKTANALKQKTLALINLKKKQRDMELKKNKNRIQNKRRGRNLRNRGGGNVKQIKNKIAKLLSSLIVKHQLFHKYKLFDREYKSLQHELREYEIGLKNTNIVLNQLNMTQNNEDEQEINGLNAENLEYEQRIEDTQSTIKYIREQMIAMSYKMKENDHKRWKQLQNAQKVSLSCTESDLERFLTISTVPYAKMCVNFLINQHLRFRLIIDDYKKQTIHLKSEQNKILTAADNEMRKKMVLIEKLQSRIHEEQQKRRFEQFKEATDTIHDIHQQHHDNNQDNQMMVDNDTDNETDNDIDEDLDINDNNNEVIPFDLQDEASLDLQADLRRKRTELNESKKLLNMFCSPQQTLFTDQNRKLFTDQNQNNCSAQTLNESLNSNLSSSFRNSMNNLNQNKAANVLEHVGHMNHGQISIQLTPFHTPLVKSKTKQFSSNPNSQFSSFLGNNHNHHNNQQQHKNNNQQQHKNNNQQHHNGNSRRSSSNSPLFRPRNEQTTPLLDHLNHSADHNDLSLAAAANKENHNRANSLNVFSRLTNPKHFTATSRTRAQELEALKQKVRRQKVSHAQLQKRGNWQKKKIYQSPPHVAHTQQAYNVNVVHENVCMQNDYDMETDMDNSNVFERLHTTSIRNTRLTHLNNSMNEACDMEAGVEREREEVNEIGIGNEPLRVFNPNEISKKPQRNINNNNAKSMLLNPHRIDSGDVI